MTLTYARKRLLSHLRAFVKYHADRFVYLCRANVVVSMITKTILPSSPRTTYVSYTTVFEMISKHEGRRSLLLDTAQDAPVEKILGLIQLYDIFLYIFPEKDLLHMFQVPNASVKNHHRAASSGTNALYCHEAALLD